MDQIILNTARKNFFRTHSDYAAVGFDESAELGNIWRPNVERFLRRFIDRTDTSVQEIMRELNMRAFYDFTVTEPLLAPSIRWYARHLKQAYGVELDQLPASIAESKHLPDERCLDRLDRRLSSDFLYRLGQVAYLQRGGSLPADSVILEVGAGYGALARALLLTVPTVRYMIVDIPETLFFAEMFLRAEFPEKRFVSIDKDTWSSDIDSADIVFVPTGFRDSINHIAFNLAISTNSLGEMPRTVSQSILHWISHDVQPARVFSVNRFLNRVSSQLFVDRSEAAGINFLWGRHWDVVDWEVNPVFEQCPFYASTVTRNLLLLANHSVGGASIDEAVASVQIADIALQDWNQKPYWDNFVLKRNGASLPMMSKNNPDLTPDLRRDGTLFQLWNTYRLSDTPATVEAARQLMAGYFAYLGGTTEPFEDKLFLEPASPA